MAAARRPFRLSDSTPATPKSAEGQPLPAKGRNSTLVPNQPIPPPSSHTQEDAGHGHSPRIPWPAAKAVDHKPMRLKGD
jgi:hypothetical protein